MATLQKRAIDAVYIAIRNGRLPALDGSIQCTDCTEIATVYDHRDYARPLEVAPVCNHCNYVRGPARNHAPPKNKPKRIQGKTAGIVLTDEEWRKLRLISITSKISQRQLITNAIRNKLHTLPHLVLEVVE